MIRKRTKVERYRAVIGLSAAGMTYEEMTEYIGVGSRQRVQQLVVTAVAKLPQLAARLHVTGQRNSGRRRDESREIEVQRERKPRKLVAPRESVRAQHIATAKSLLQQNGGRYPGATEMMRLGHSALYQFMRKYPANFEHLTGEHRAVSEQPRRKRRRRRRF